jgi:hypothetical protein
VAVLPALYAAIEKSEGQSKTTEKIKEVSSVLTTNDYSALITVKVPSHISKLLFCLKEEDVNDVLFKIEGSMDQSFVVAVELKAETLLVKDSVVFETLSDPWLYVRVLHKAAVAEAQGRTSCGVSGSG